MNVCQLAPKIALSSYFRNRVEISPEIRHHMTVFFNRFISQVA